MLAECVAGRSDLSEYDVTHARPELGATIGEFVAIGRSVRLKGVGLITPSMNARGELSICILPNPRLLRRINDRSRFVGSIANAHNLGKTGNELVAQWNELYPDDPVE